MRGKIIPALFLVLIFLLPAGCSDDAGTDSRTVAGTSGQQVILDGVWKACVFGTGRVLTFSGGSLTDVVSNHSDETCADLPAESFRLEGTFLLQGTATPTLSGVVVRAAKLDFALENSVVKDVIHVDDGQTPNIMYAGDRTTKEDAEGYPTELAAFLPFARQ